MIDTTISTSNSDTAEAAERVTEIRRLVSSLPAIEQCNEETVLEADLLITAGGFEARVFGLPQRLKAGAIRRAVLLEYEPNDPRNRLTELREALSNNGIEITDDDIVKFDRYDPEDFEARLKKLINAHGPERVLLDISGMSKLAILLCLEVCRKINLNTYLFYCEAEEKAPSLEKYELAKKEGNLHRPSIQIYTGIHSVIHVACLSSVAMQGQPSAAIAFMSFNELLTQALLNAVFPARLFLINTASDTWRWRESATAWIHEQLRQEWPSEDNPLEGPSKLPVRKASAINYQEALTIILNLYWQLAIDHRITLAPTGTKMQTVGCFLARALHPDIHIEYPTPEGFFENYSKRIGRGWLIRFGKIDDLVINLTMNEKRALLGTNANGHDGSSSAT